MSDSKANLLIGRIGYKPFQYPWAYENWKRQQQIHWLPEEANMADDIREWGKKGLEDEDEDESDDEDEYDISRLTRSERRFLTQIFRFFTQADIEVHDCYMTKYASIFKPVEIKMMLAAFSNMETVHIAAYAHLIDSLGLPETEYQVFMEYKEMKDKYDYMQQFNVDSKHNIALTLAVFGAFTEGLQLFASFAMLLNFPRFGKMKGMGQIITWSVRDESLHAESIIRLFKTFIHENPEVWNQELIDQLNEACATIVDLEDKFIELAFSTGGVRGLTASEVKHYIRFTANKRLKALGLQKMYAIPRDRHGNDVNPLPWVDTMVNAVEHANFFENRATEYSKAATQGEWYEAFEGLESDDGSIYEYQYEYKISYHIHYDREESDDSDIQHRTSSDDIQDFIDANL